MATKKNETKSKKDPREDQKRSKKPRTKKKKPYLCGPGSVGIDMSSVSSCAKVSWTRSSLRVEERSPVEIRRLGQKENPWKPQVFGVEKMFDSPSTLQQGVFGSLLPINKPLETTWLWVLVEIRRLGQKDATQTGTTGIPFIIIGVFRYPVAIWPTAKIVEITSSTHLLRSFLVVLCT